MRFIVYVFISTMLSSIVPGAFSIAAKIIILEGTTGKGKKGVRVGKKSEGFAVFQTLRVFAMSIDRKIRELATS